MWFLEKRRFQHAWTLTPEQALLVLLFLKWPVRTTAVSAALVLRFQYKLHAYLTAPAPVYAAEAGDILVYFSHTSSDISDWIFWCGLCTLHTHVPVRHYSNVLDEAHYVDVRRSGKINGYDNITRGPVYDRPRLAKLKYIDADWGGNSEIMVIKTDARVDAAKREEVLRAVRRGVPWTAGGGCLGLANQVQRIMDDTCPRFFRVEDILKHYKDARIGRLLRV